MKRLRSAVEYVLQSLQAFRSAVSATDSCVVNSQGLCTHTYAHTRTNTVDVMKI